MFKHNDNVQYQEPWNHRCLESLKGQGIGHFGERKMVRCGKPARSLVIMGKCTYLCRTHATAYLKRLDTIKAGIERDLAVRAKRKTGSTGD